jgi:flagellin-specific chaperone FliS
MTNDAKTAARIYRERAVEGASPARIVRLLLERAMRGIDVASAADARDPRSPFVSELQRANDIVSELRLAIVPVNAGDSENASGAVEAASTSAATDALYQFVGDQIHTALARREAEPALRARPILATLHDAWCRIEQGTA